jgi:prepilin-type N-terminal cleavage/methylation domain-containing protein
MTFSRRGFTLIEIMIAMTILVVMLGGFAALTFQYIRNAETASATMARAAIVNEQVQSLTALPFDSLSQRAGCISVTTGPLAYRRCITLTTVSSTQVTVTLIITPTSTLIKVKADTTAFDRTKPVTYNPLKT